MTCSRCGAGVSDKDVEHGCVVKPAHDLYSVRGRIIRRFDRVSLKDLIRFADALDKLNDEEMQVLADFVEAGTKSFTEHPYTKSKEISK